MGAMRCAPFLLAAACLLAAAPASACRIPRPPALPIRGDYSAVALATIVGGDEYGAVARLDEVIDGHEEGPTAALDYGTRGGEGIIVTSCGPPGPRVATGARVVLIFRRFQARRVVSGWVALDDAARMDDFFARYVRETSPAVRQKLRRRWHLVNVNQGPVPLTNPRNWLRPHVGGLGWVGPDGFSYVGFRIDDDGGIADCAPVRNFGPGGAPDPRDATICARIADRRFLPPMFARERMGNFRVRWAG
jgi:hypothetical protein